MMLQSSHLLFTRGKSWWPVHLLPFPVTTQDPSQSSPPAPLSQQLFSAQGAVGTHPTKERGQTRVCSPQQLPHPSRQGGGLRKAAGSELESKRAVFFAAFLRGWLQMPPFGQQVGPLACKPGHELPRSLSRPRRLVFIL